MSHSVSGVVSQVSKAAYGLCCWVRAMESYDRVAKVVEPKKASLAAAEEQLDVVMTALRSKQAKLQVRLSSLFHGTPVAAFLCAWDPMHASLCSVCGTRV